LLHERILFFITLFLLHQLLGLSLSTAGSVCHYMQLFADEGISMGKDTSTLGSILRNSSVTDQGKKAKAVMHY
jgi:hypothetical protein